MVMISKIRDIIQERRLPWVIVTNYEKAVNFVHFVLNKFSCHNKRHDLKPSISISCDFHGKSGGLYAVASIANMVSLNHQVRFVTYPTSNYNPLLENRIEMVTLLPVDADVYILDVSCNHETYLRIKNLGKPIIVSCHGLKDTSHGLNQDYVVKSLEYADMVHFVNLVQQGSFNCSDDKYIVIPNASKCVNKVTVTNDVGVVGNLNDERKNAVESVEIFSKSNADRIHLWCCDAAKYQHERGVVCHNWESDKSKIYNSFDVLVFMGKQETFSLTVIEAMSAGIPCLISAIPAHEQYRNCPGIILVDESNRSYAHELLDDLMARKHELKGPMISYWQEHYYEPAVAKQWDALIKRLCP